jgi:hypothetical protein
VTDPLLSRRQLGEALRALSDQLRTRNTTGEIYVFGGGALVLGFDARESTRDLDGRIDEHHGAVQDSAHEVAGELGLPRHWLNEGGTVYLPRGPDAGASVVYQDEWLTVRAASAHVLLAMKAGARRAQDIVDTVFLAELLGLVSADEIAAAHDHHYPDQPLTDDDWPRLEAIEAILAQGPSAPEGLGEVIERARARRNAT